jgi:thiamine-phosphate pyrophosphorylase
MLRRHPLPKIWLMTDERIVDLDGAIARLPRRSGIVFRHYSLAPKARRVLFDHVRKLARQHRHIILLADTPLRAWAWRADGAHHRSELMSQGLRSVAVHDVAERVSARRARADLIFVSPVYRSRSHPGKSSLGPIGLARLAGADRTKTIALGGMSANRAKKMRALRLYGWAAIDAFSQP